MNKLQEIKERHATLDDRYLSVTIETYKEDVASLLQVVEEQKKALKRICNLEEPQYQSEYSVLFRLSQAIARKALGKE